MLDKKVQQLFKEATTYEITKLEREFEASKLSIIPDSTEEKIKLSTPKLVREYITNKKMMFVEDAPISYNNNDETLEVKRQFVREKLFATPCALINQTVLKVLKEQPEIKIVVLVGGFAESGIVQQNVAATIKETFPDVKVVVPTSPFRAVLTGAVLFGHNTFIFKSRISRATYGVGTNQLFDEAMHNPLKKWLDEENNVHRCKDVFSIHVKKGDSVALNVELEAKTYIPLYKAQKEVSIPVYESSEVGPTDGSVMYTTDSGCTKIADIKVAIPTANESSERGVSVRMIYGGTQLSVNAVCTHTGKVCPAVIRFN
ncbi:hypothetical protein DPMN_175273 [Dreissena polymorpha]|uniref:Uncharacterized protein n=1 Tax=Dreissena polymorpha TaxID=45954 RepID=A0A9D4IIK8_DREPO|nr:hypothetical protein DPMN_175273 [Dreissena polymorpha]